jgi:primosomal protein N'
MRRKVCRWAEESDYPSLQVIGPVPCFYSRRNGRYRWQILLRGNTGRELLKAHPLQAWQPHGVNVEITVDPPDIL